MSNHPLPLAKKELGQNFLRNKSILDTIVGGDLSGKYILEVGPGPGDLTAAILRQHPESLVVAEIDADMIPLLESRFADQHLSIYTGDVLHLSICSGKPTDSSGIRHLKKTEPLHLPAYSVYGNIPYYITSPIIHHFLYDVQHLPEILTFTMQKEVADRILARDEKHSVLSIGCQLIADVQKVCDIHPQNFIPVPKVWSTCLRFIIKPDIDREFLKKTYQIVKTGFAQKRKKLISNLAQKYDRKKLSSAFEHLGLDENIRAEDLTLDHWRDIARAIH